MYSWFTVWRQRKTWCTCFTYMHVCTCMYMYMCMVEPHTCSCMLNVQYITVHMHIHCMCSHEMGSSNYPLWSVECTCLLQNVDCLRQEIRSLQSKLSEVSTTAIKQGERLRDKKKTKRELEQENVDLKTTMTNAQVHVYNVYMIYSLHICIITLHVQCEHV